MVTGKVWGETRALLVTPMIEVHRILIQPGMVCSMHKHQFKWNAFLVIRGRLNIEVRKKDYALTDVTELREGDFTTVAPGEFHRFVSLDEYVDALEIYYPEGLSADIVRENVGGLAS